MTPRMTQSEIDAALDELDRLLNDLDTPMDPDRVWALLAEVSPCLRDTVQPVAGLPPVFGRLSGPPSARPRVS